MWQPLFITVCADPHALAVALSRESARARSVTQYIPLLNLSHTHSLTHCPSQSLARSVARSRARARQLSFALFRLRSRSLSRALSPALALACPPPLSPFCRSIHVTRPGLTAGALGPAIGLTMVSLKTINLSLKKNMYPPPPPLPPSLFSSGGAGMTRRGVGGS